MESKNLLFEHYSESDFSIYFQLVNNPEVMKMILGRPLLEEEARIRFKDMLKLNQTHTDVGHFKISNILTGDNIGHAKLVMTETHQAEIGYLMHPEYWRKGYGGEIAESLVKAAERSAVVEELIAIIDPENIASKKILEGQGFQWDREGEYFGLPAVYYILKLSNKAKK